MLNMATDQPCMGIYQQSKEIMRITTDGRVIWYGKPSQAADVLKTLLENVIDDRVATPAMRERTYERACRSILARARTMDHEELIDFLERSLQNRSNKCILLALQDAHEKD